MLIFRPLVMAGKDFLGGNVFFGEGVEVTFTGLHDLHKSLPPDCFEITGANTAKFLGKNAIYKAYYYMDGEYLICRAPTGCNLSRCPVDMRYRIWTSVCALRSNIQLELEFTI